MRAAVPALGGARRGSRSAAAAAAPELLSKVLQAPRPRPRLGRLRRCRRAPARRAPQRSPSRERARPTRRRGRAWCSPGAGAAAVLNTSRVRCPQGRGREPEERDSPCLSEDPDSRGGGDARRRPAPPRPRADPPALLAACSAPLRRSSGSKPAACESRAARAAELGPVGNAGAGPGPTPTPPGAPPKHVLPLFPPRRPQLRDAGALSALSPPRRRGANPGRGCHPSRTRSHPRRPGPKATPFRSTSSFPGKKLGSLGRKEGRGDAFAEAARVSRADGVDCPIPVKLKQLLLQPASEPLN
ncbi:atherin-like [Saccopteryx leptura]|uniref:atherin-like n=1 Tax=Saccopteryx leptura TaxID=249018 RepID=UPI00339CD0AC